MVCNKTMEPNNSMNLRKLGEGKLTIISHGKH